MATCVQCTFHKRDEDGKSGCANHDLEYTDHVLGRRECRLLNPDGNCKHFKQSRRVQVTGMLISGAILVFLIGTVVLYHRSERTRPQRIREKQALGLAKQPEKEQVEAEKQLTAARIAKPAKVWKGTVGGFEVYIEEFHPFRQ